MSAVQSIDLMPALASTLIAGGIGKLAICDLDGEGAIARQSGEKLFACSRHPRALSLRYETYWACRYAAKSALARVTLGQVSSG